jgi:LDH2 family malate/lactate/ureidoglycolate dehydrogenase
LTRLLRRVGCSEEAASDTADALLEADLRGYAFEGALQFPSLLRAIQANQVNAQATPRVVHEREASLLIDGDGGVPPFVGKFAARLVIQRARSAGCCVAGLVNCEALYMLGYFAGHIAEAGLVGLVASAGRPRVHPYGGIDPILGTNPLAIAIPTEAGPPVLLDIATSAMAFGAALETAFDRELLPEGVAIGPDGEPTRDVKRAADGALSPFGGHKGFALGLCIGLLAGPLVGGAVGRALADVPGSGRRSARGHLMVAIDAAAFGDPAAFRRAVSLHLREVKGSRRAPGVDAIRIPGERSFAERARRLREGVPIPARVLEATRAIAHELDVAAPELEAGGPDRTGRVP